MSYSSEAIAFSTIPPNQQVRIEDRISFLYLERCIIRQSKTGVVAVRDNEYAELGRGSRTLQLQLPVAGTAVLCLGPGTSISHAAITSCARAGCTVIFSGADGVNCYAHATPLTSSAKWALAQAAIISDSKAQVAAAIELYKKQFGIDAMPGGTIKALRGLEGRMMRNAYRDSAKRAKISGFKRDTGAIDPVNTGLNVANSIMYGVAATVCAAIGVNPALGIIHRGDARALLFDLADLYKASIVIPLVFSHAHDAEPLPVIRRDLRAVIFRKKLMIDMLGTLMEVLTPYLPNRDDDRLIGDDGAEVVGHVQYGGE
ncbi:MAG: type I-E CRISPR-associated endonuclease Cas1e [Arcanobacterium sp.]|nr:type I-E CRISPR-associated endonuclease Cas1e [Arcanobacterium sp.]MDY5589672.1 type I-E CRISPR-associated endonuclease Cas1e [Arcanobacterium sp.]